MGDGGASHPSVLFETVQMRKGDALMFQGILPSEPAIFMTNEGTVDFRRYATSSLAIRPLTKSSWAKTCSRPKAGVAGACENKGGDDPFKQQNGFEQAIVDQLQDRDSFCTLAALPLPGPEPFTVVIASEEAVLYRITGSTILKMPPKALKELRLFLAQSLGRRLRALPECAVAAPSTPPLTPLWHSQSLPSLRQR